MLRPVAALRSVALLRPVAVLTALLTGAPALADGLSLGGPSVHTGWTWPTLEELDDVEEDDFCATEGWYGDGVCDDDCLYPDPDCAEPDPNGADPNADVCEDEGWYGDGICDDFCAEPDPDCA